MGNSSGRGSSSKSLSTSSSSSLSVESCKSPYGLQGHEPSILKVTKEDDVQETNIDSETNFRIIKSLENQYSDSCKGFYLLLISRNSFFFFIKYLLLL